MPQIDVTIKGVKDLSRQLRNAESKMYRNLQDALKESALLAVRKMKQLTPIDTGNLHRSIDADYSNLRNFEVKIGPDIQLAPYAPFVEYGHRTRSGSWVPGQYYIRRTVTEVSPLINTIMNEAVSQALRRT